MVSAQQEQHRAPHHWSKALTGTPVNVPANTTTITTVELPVWARAIVVMLTTPANVSAFSIRGTGSRATYESFSAAQGSNFVIVGVVPSIDDHLDISVTTNVTGACLVYAVGVSDDLLGFSVLADGSSGPVSDGVQAFNMLYNGATWDRMRSSAAADGQSLGIIAAGGMVFNGATYTRIVAPGALLDANSGGNLASGFNFLYNGSQYDRQYNNQSATLLASAARTVQTDSPLQTNFNGRGVVVTLNVTAASGAGGLIVRFLVSDPVSGAVGFINAAPANVIATGLTSYALYPGATAGYTQVTNSVLPRIWGVRVQVGDASSYTYSVAAQTIL